MNCTLTYHIVMFTISVHCHAVYYLAIHLWVFVVLFFVSFLVMSGKLKCHPSPIHRPDRDRKLSQPPFILLPSPLHPPISTHVSVVTGNSDKGTLMGKNMLSLSLQGKAASFHSITSPFYALPKPHLICGRIMSVFQMAALDCFIYVQHGPYKRNGNLQRFNAFEALLSTVLLNSQCKTARLMLSLFRVLLSLYLTSKASLLLQRSMGDIGL